MRSRLGSRTRWPAYPRRPAPWRRGRSGTVWIRGGTREVELTPLAACTFFLDVEATVAACGRLARAVDPCQTVEAASRALNEIGVRTELDLELAAASQAGS